MNLTARVPVYQAIAAQMETNGQWAMFIGLAALLTLVQQLGLLGQVRVLIQYPPSNNLLTKWR